MLRYDLPEKEVPQVLPFFVVSSTYLAYFNSFVVAQFNNQLFGMSHKAFIYVTDSLVYDNIC
jgi:hypothetical protein